MVSAAPEPPSSPSPPPTVDTDVTPDGFGGSVQTPGSSGVGIRSGPPIDCPWKPHVIETNSGDSEGLGRFLAAHGAQDVNESGHPTRVVDGVVEVLYFYNGADCDFGYAWVGGSPDPADLIPGLVDDFRETLALPSPNISPAAEFGALVNFGLWIAVDDPGVVVRTASNGPVWVEGTGRHTSITMDLGNGDSVTCAGLGTPIVDTDTAEQGPCGYTYRRTNRPAEGFPATLTSTYTVTFRLSNGDGRSPETVERQIRFEYPVRELQVVVSNG